MRKLEIPVLLITFNRPDVTAIVLERILEMNPPKIYIFNDAPRQNNSNDREKCNIIRNSANNLSYSGQILTRFEEKNLGCKVGEATAMTWLFENEEMGIVLEDDIFPSHDFFYFCQEMLLKYKDDNRIFSISGCNLINTWKENINDYHFSLFGSFWGWAGWKRSWNHYNIEMPEWNNEVVRNLILQYLPTSEYRELRMTEFDALVNGQNDTWDFQFCFAHFINHALSIVPSKNMVQNIGINRPDAVHMVGESPFSDLVAYPVSLPMQHNPIMIPDYDYDIEVIKKAYPYFYEIPVYPEAPMPNTKQKISMKIGAMVGEKGLLRDLTNLILGRKK